MQNSQVVSSSSGSEEHGTVASVLEVSHVTKRYGSFVALNDVSLTVNQGEILGLMGHNGAGKSTLIKVIAGAEEPSDGTVRIEGRLLGRDGDSKVLRQRIAVVYQELRTIENVSVAENLLYPALPKRFGIVDRKQLYSRAREILDAEGIDVSERVIASQLSQADRQLIEIAAARSRGAELLLLDEPTSSLGAVQIEALLTVIRREAQHGTAIIFVTHKIGEVLEVADRLVVLRDGRVVAAGLTREFTRERLVGELTGVFGSDASPVDGGIERVRSAAISADSALVARELKAGGVVSATIDVRRGEIVGLYGLLGSGRSALLRALYGANPITGGVLEVFGERFRPSSPKAALSKGLMFLTEDRKRDGIIPDLSVSANAAIAALRKFKSIGGLIKRRKLRSTSLEEARRLNIRARLDEPVRALSGGNQQKVLFSRLHLSGALILLLDEPTRGVDVGAKREIYDVIREEAAQGKAVLVASSEAEEICELCNRCYVVIKGRTGDVILEGSAMTPGSLRRAAASEEEGAA